MQNSDGFDPKQLNTNAEYTIRQLADLMPFSVQFFRKEIREGKLKARKKGKLLLVKGSAAVDWWKKE